MLLLASAHLGKDLGDSFVRHASLFELRYNADLRSSWGETVGQSIWCLNSQEMYDCYPCFRSRSKDITVSVCSLEDTVGGGFEQ